MIAADLEIVRVGPPLSSAAAVVVMLHGRGRSPSDILQIADRLALSEIAYLAVPAPGGTWYPQSFLAPFEDNQPHLDDALARVDAAIRDLERVGRSRRHVAIIGFSQGACLATEYVRRNPERWGALIAFTGGLIGPPEHVWEARGDLARTPVLLATSDVDAWVPLRRVRQTADVLRAMNGAVDERVYAGMDHIVHDDAIATARIMLSNLLESARARG